MLKWFWLYMILLKSIFSGISFPNKKESLHCNVIYESFAFLLKARNMRSCSGSQVQWTETRMQLLWKGCYLSKLLYPESAFAELSRNQTHRCSVVLPICGTFYNVVLRKLLVLIQEGFSSKTSMLERIMPLPEKGAFFAMPCSLTIFTLPIPLPSSRKISLCFQTHTQKCLT